MCGWLKHLYLDAGEEWECSLQVWVIAKHCLEVNHYLGLVFQCHILHLCTWSSVSNATYNSCAVNQLVPQIRVVLAVEYDMFMSISISSTITSGILQRHFFKRVWPIFLPYRLFYRWPKIISLFLFTLNLKIGKVVIIFFLLIFRIGRYSNFLFLYNRILFVKH